uniref:Uncharacterized protein n=1 Tax=Glossina morsitans morsitans TaxID=37546 RepID=A0A1B0FJ38_GLOMM
MSAWSAGLTIMGNDAVSSKALHNCKVEAVGELKIAGIMAVVNLTRRRERIEYDLNRGGTEFQPNTRNFPARCLYIRVIIHDYNNNFD